MPLHQQWMHPVLDNQATSLQASLLCSCCALLLMQIMTSHSLLAAWTAVPIWASMLSHCSGKHKPRCKYNLPASTGFDIIAVICGVAFLGSISNSSSLAGFAGKYSWLELGPSQFGPSHRQFVCAIFESLGNSPGTGGICAFFGPAGAILQRASKVGY